MATTLNDKKTLRAEMRLTIEINARDQLSVAGNAALMPAYVVDMWFP
ncbi:MAG: hypothetical protein AB1810_02760 [Pseudomonadota bacterium]